MGPRPPRKAINYDVDESWAWAWPMADCVLVEPGQPHPINLGIEARQIPLNNDTTNITNQLGPYGPELEWGTSAVEGDGIDLGPSHWGFQTTHATRDFHAWAILGYSGDYESDEKALLSVPISHTLNGDYRWRLSAAAPFDLQSYSNTTIKSVGSPISIPTDTYFVIVAWKYNTASGNYWRYLVGRLDTGAYSITEQDSGGSSHYLGASYPARNVLLGANAQNDEAVGIRICGFYHWYSQGHRELMSDDRALRLFHDFWGPIRPRQLKPSDTSSGEVFRTKVYVP